MALRTGDGGFAISSKRSVDLFNAGAAEPAANRSVVLDFQVEDVDKERSRLQVLVKNFVLEPTPVLGEFRKRPGFCGFFSLIRS